MLCDLYIITFDIAKVDKTKCEIFRISTSRILKIFAHNNNHSLKFLITSFTFWLWISFCCLYQINAKSRKHLSNKVNKFDSRYWYWHCRSCCTKFAISQNKFNFWISHRKVASKKSIFATTKVNFATFRTFNSTRLISFEISSFVLFNCKTNEHSNDFWWCSLKKILLNSKNFNEQWIHFVMNLSSIFLNSTTIIVFLFNDSNQNQFVKITNFFSYVFRNLTNETEKDSIFDFSTIFDSISCWSYKANEQCDAFWKCFFKNSKVQCSLYNMKHRM